MIAELGDLLGDADVRFWLSGGWAVDFYVGQITRSHTDVDIVVSLDDRPNVFGLLDRAGFGSEPLDKREGIVWYERAGVRLEITFISESPDGSIVTPGYEFWPWPTDSFADETVSFSGITVRAVSIAGILDMKRGWAEKIGRPPRPYDVDDIEALESLE